MDAIAAFTHTSTEGLSAEMLKAIYGATGLVGGGFIFRVTHNYSYYGSREATGVSTQLRDMEVRAHLIAQWQHEAHQYIEDLSGCPRHIRRLLYRSGVVAVALVTYRYTGSDASHFWRLLAQDDGLRRNDPRKALLTFLINRKYQEDTPSTLARYVAQAWNAAFKNSERTVLRVTNTISPIFIAGTPHDGVNHWVYLGDQGEVLEAPIMLKKHDIEELELGKQIHLAS
jgi:hypothetical protein